MLEYERQERRTATELRKKEMEERIVRVREKERKEKLAAKKMNGRAVKRRVYNLVDLANCRKRNSLRMRVNSCWMSIILKMKAQKVLLRMKF